MIDEPTEELASLYALDLLDGGELAAFEERLRTEPDLRVLVEDFRASAASLAHTSPLRSPSPELPRKIFDAIQREQPPIVVGTRANWIPWAIAASLVAACALLAIDRDRLSRQVAALEHRDLLAQTQIALLSSKLDSAPKARAVVVWDAQKQEGVLKLVDLPATATDRDYQLWMVDPQYKQPVDAGVFAVARNGTTKISFRPKAKVHSVDGFAVSLERKGGVPKAEGPMVLVGN